MSARTRLALACIWALPLMASAEDTSRFDLLKTAEMPGHRALMQGVQDPETPLAPFTTDGCSGGMSAGWALVAEQFPDLAQDGETTLPWTQCCVTHDQSYHNAGGAQDAEASFAARLAADTALRDCVIATGQAEQAATMDRLDLTAEQVDRGYRLLALSMYRAVRLGGGPCSGLPWRWGYGYPQCWNLP